MYEKNESEAEKFIRENISITGLEIAESGVNTFDAPDIYRRVGQNDNPFIILIPHNEVSIESVLDYWLVLCLRSSKDIRKVAARAKLERNPPTNPDNFEPVELSDQNGSLQIPFPGKPDAPKDFYHRWWRWPKGRAWREPGEYFLKIKLGYNQYQPSPVPPTPESEADWISKPITYKILIKKREPPKKEDAKE
jgi:hypothetical protein